MDTEVSREWRTSAVILGVVLLCLAFVAVATIRDSGLGGPHHDEVIAIQAAKGEQPEYTRLQQEQRPPFGTVVPARDWQRMVDGLSPQPFAKVRDGMLQGDIHPPLAFWLMGQWSGLTGEPGYSGQLALSVLWVLLIGGVLARTLDREGLDAWPLLLCAGLFLFSNAALTTAVWIRQYGLSCLWFLLTVGVALKVVRQWTFSRAALLPMFALGGMLTHFEYITMTALVHAAVLFWAWREGGSRRALVLLTGYVMALAAFMLLMPDAIQLYLQGGSLDKHAGTWMTAISALGQAWLPVPSQTPLAVAFALGFVVLLAPIMLVAARWSLSVQGAASGTKPGLSILVAAALGCGLLQVTMVAVGVFPAMATQAHHMLPLVCVTLLCLGAVLVQPDAGRIRWLLPAASVAMLGMLVLQLAYLRNLQMISARYHTQYAATGHDLVIIDNLSRGFVLSVAAVLRPDQPVLVAPAEQLAARLRDGSLGPYPRIVYVPMDETVREGKPAVLAAAAQAGRKIEEYPVVFVGLYEAIGLHAQP